MSSLASRVGMARLSKVVEIVVKVRDIEGLEIA